jgi:hypothetical protein
MEPNIDFGGSLFARFGKTLPRKLPPETLNWPPFCCGVRSTEYEICNKRATDAGSFGMAPL